MLRQPYRRRSHAEWDEIRRLYQAGATAKALTKEYGGTERTLYSRARRDGWLAGTLERLARGAAGDGGGAYSTEPGRRAALDFLREQEGE